MNAAMNAAKTGPARAAVVVNPVKVVGLDAHRAEIGAALAEAGCAGVQPRELDGDVIAPARSLTVEVRPLALTVCVAEDAAQP